MENVKRDTLRHSQLRAGSKRQCVLRGQDDVSPDAGRDGQLLVLNPSSPFREEHVCQYDVGLLRCCSGGQVRPIIRQAMDTATSYAVAEWIPGDLF